MHKRPDAHDGWFDPWAGAMTPIYSEEYYYNVFAHGHKRKLKL